MKTILLLILAAGVAFGQCSKFNPRTGKPDATGCTDLLWSFCPGHACNNDTAPAPRPTGVTRSLLSCMLMAGTAPSAGTIVLDVLLDGVSVFGANPKPTIAQGATCKDNAAGCTVSTFATALLPSGAHYLTAAVTGTSGQDVVALCVAK